MRLTVSIIPAPDAESWYVIVTNLKGRRFVSVEHSAKDAGKFVAFVVQTLLEEPKG